ncbi:hypothetical protein ACROYT_G042701 [Oculina patagonica]
MKEEPQPLNDLNVYHVLLCVGLFADVIQAYRIRSFVQKASSRRLVRKCFDITFFYIDRVSMDMKFVILLLVIEAVLGKPANQDEAGSCDVNPSYRFECGWLGIDKDTCLKRNCCWDDSDPQAKFCFVRKYKNLPDGLCPYLTLSGVLNSPRKNHLVVTFTMVCLENASMCVIRDREKTMGWDNAGEESAVFSWRESSHRNI